MGQRRRRSPRNFLGPFVGPPNFLERYNILNLEHVVYCIYLKISLVISTYHLFPFETIKLLFFGSKFIEAKISFCLIHQLDLSALKSLGLSLVG